MIILRGNKWRAKVGLVTCTISLPLSPSLWRHGCQPCKCSVRVIREQRGPDREQPTSRQALQRRRATTSLSPGSSLVCQPPCLQDEALQSAIGNHLVKEIAGSMIYSCFMVPLGQKQLYLKGLVHPNYKNTYFLT